jgi:hypothetical protein
MIAKKRKRPAVGYGSPPVRSRFKKGRVKTGGRQLGTPNKVSHRLAFDKLVKIMQSKSAPVASQVKAAQIILNLAMLGLVDADETDE